MPKISNYRVLNQIEYKQQNYSLRTIAPKDIQDIRIWRNAQMDYLRQKKEINIGEQEKYFNENIWPSFKALEPDQILFSFFEGKELIGYGGLVHISWIDKRGEISFLVDPKFIENHKEYQRIFRIFLEILMHIFFNELSFNKLTTETYDLRPYHIEVYSKVGLVLEGTLKSHIYLNGQYINALVHGCLRKDFVSRKNKFEVI